MVTRTTLAETAHVHVACAAATPTAPTNTLPSNEDDKAWENQHGDAGI